MLKKNWSCSWGHSSCNTGGFLQCLLHLRRRLQPESKIRPWRFEVPNLALHKTATSQSYREPRPLTRFKAAQHIIPCFAFQILHVCFVGTRWKDSIMHTPCALRPPEIATNEKAITALPVCHQCIEAKAKHPPSPWQIVWVSNPKLCNALH